MDRLQRLFNMGGGGGGMGGMGGGETAQVDTSEQIYISSLALLKMLKHGRAGVPMEVSAPPCDIQNRSPACFSTALLISTEVMRAPP